MCAWSSCCMCCFLVSLVMRSSSVEVILVFVVVSGCGGS